MTKKRKEQYKALAIIWAGFTLIGWRLHQPWLMVAAGVVLVAGIASPWILDKVTSGWKWIGEQIGAVTSRIILGVVFVVFLSPIAFFYRLSARGKKKGTPGSFFVERNHKYTAADLEKLF